MEKREVSMRTKEVTFVAIAESSVVSENNDKEY